MNGIRLASIVALAVAVTVVAPAEVTFEVRQNQLPSSATAVFLAGSFNGWSTNTTPMALDGTIWRTSVSLSDGRHEYKFVFTDANRSDNWINDPANPYLADNGESGANNIVDVRNGVQVAPAGTFERFEWEAPEAKSCFVTGDFNNWKMDQFPLQPQGGGTWVAYLPLARPYAYKFAVDGRWKCDRWEQAARVPNALGGLNSFRAAAIVTSPSAVTIARTIAAGDTAELDRVRALAAAGDYGQAIALARAVADVNAAARGTSAPIVLKAIDAEARVHRRWNRLSDAAVCWQRLVDSNVETTETFQALRELAAYHLFVTKDRQAGRRLIAMAIARAPNELERIRAGIRNATSLRRERRHTEAVQWIEQLAAKLPAPETEGDAYACEWAELHLVKGVSHYFLREWDNARQAFETVVQSHPYDDSEHVEKAQRWLLACDRAQNRTAP